MEEGSDGSPLTGGNFGFALRLLKIGLTKIFEGRMIFFVGDVDMPYTEKICHNITNTNNVTWYFNDFRLEENRANYEKIIEKAGYNGKFDKFHID